jgi:hypothetical protein
MGSFGTGAPTGGHAYGQRKKVNVAEALANEIKWRVGVDSDLAEVAVIYQAQGASTRRLS